MADNVDGTLSVLVLALGTGAEAVLQRRQGSTLYVTFEELMGRLTCLLEYEGHCHPEQSRLTKVCQLVSSLRPGNTYSWMIVHTLVCQYAPKTIRSPDRIA